MLGERLLRALSTWFEDMATVEAMVGVIEGRSEGAPEYVLKRFAELVEAFSEAAMLAQL